MWALSRGCPTLVRQRGSEVRVPAAELGQSERVSSPTMLPVVKEGSGAMGLYLDSGELGSSTRVSVTPRLPPYFLHSSIYFFFLSLFTSQGEMKGNGKISEQESFSSGEMSFFIVKNNTETQSFQYRLSSLRGKSALSIWWGQSNTHCYLHLYLSDC